MTFIARNWQKECGEREREHRARQDSKVFMLEAAPGAGKSAMAAMIAQEWLAEGVCDHVLIVAPWLPVVASIEETLEAFSIESSRSLFTGTGYQPPPISEVSILTNRAACSAKTIDAIRAWSQSHGFRFALIIDEIHHASVTGAWGNYLATLGDMSERVVVMSGTPFRSDSMPIQFVQYHNNSARSDYSIDYQASIAAGYVRHLAVRYVNGIAVVKDHSDDSTYERSYDALNDQEAKSIQDDLLDFRSELVRMMIEMVHSDLMRIRNTPRHETAGALFVARPGTTKGEADKRVYQLARRVNEVTGIDPVVVTHKDRDVEGKLRAFRRGDHPYIVAVNMISEGCDIPRLRSVALLRMIESEMLFRQIAGRIVRRMGEWDNNAAMIYMPPIGVMHQFAERLYAEAQQGVSIRRLCPTCGHLPCQCHQQVCQQCGVTPCACPRCSGCGFKVWSCRCTPLQRQYELIDSESEAGAGRLANDDVQPTFIELAEQVVFHSEVHRAANTVEMGHFLQIARSMQTEEGHASPQQARQRKLEKIERFIRRIAARLYSNHEKLCWTKEVMEHPQFQAASLGEVQARWSSDQIDALIEHLRRRVEEVLRNG